MAIPGSHGIGIYQPGLRFFVFDDTEIDDAHGVADVCSNRKSIGIKRGDVGAYNDRQISSRSECPFEREPLLVVRLVPDRGGHRESSGILGDAQKDRNGWPSCDRARVALAIGTSSCDECEDAKHCDSEFRVHESCTREVAPVV